MNEVIQQLDFLFSGFSFLDLFASGSPQGKPRCHSWKVTVVVPGPPRGAEVNRLWGLNTAHLTSAFAYVLDA